VPQELPGATRHFVGRAHELALLDVMAFEGDPALPRIAVVTGMGGVGKTALTVRWAWRVAGRFPDGQLYVNLRGFDPVEPVDPADALAMFLRSLGVRPAEVPQDVSERSARYRTLLSQRRVLIVLDNARNAEHVRPLLPSSPLCMVVVTSRDVLAGIVSSEGASRVRVDPLSVRDSTTLLRKVAGDRFDTPEEAELLARHCDGLPLAIRVAAEVAARRADVPLTQLIGDLGDIRIRLDVLDTGETQTTARSVLSWSYRLLSPEGARLFRLFGCAPGPDLSARAVASLGGLSEAEARRLLNELTRSHMLTETTPGRYGMHDVLYAYAAELAHAVDREQDRDVAVRRLLDYYLGTAAAADRLLEPKRLTTAPNLATPADSGLIERIQSAEGAQRWFAQEHAALLSAVQLAVQRGFAQHSWQLVWAMTTYLDRGGFWHEWAAASSMALEATTDPAAQAHLHELLARAAAPLGLLDTALEHYGQALEVLVTLDDRFGQALMRSNLAGICGLSGRFRQAAEHGGLALALFKDLGDVVGQARALINIGTTHAKLGEYPLALSACHESLTLLRGRGDRFTEAHVMNSLGYIHRGMGEHDQAIEYYHRALALFEEISNRLRAADMRTELGDTYAEIHRHDEARRAWQASLAILDDLDHPDAAAVRARLETGTPPR
jgi:tetratricopeptide (TPR) repeat protein